MTLQREHDDFVQRLRALKNDPLIGSRLKKGSLDLKSLSEKDIDRICRRSSDDAGFYFLMAAARLSRTKLKAAKQDPGVKIAPKGMQRAFALKRHLPPTCMFEAVVEAAAALRVPDIDRKGSGDVERILRERLIEEAIPIAMAPLALTGMKLARTDGVLENAELRKRIRDQVTKSLPLVVAILICTKAEAEPYRDGAEAFVDRVFFQEEIEDCIAFLKARCAELARHTG